MEEMSTLEPINYVQNALVLDSLKSLCLRCKYAITKDELYEIVCDVEVLENKALDVRTKEVLTGVAQVMRQRLHDYEQPMMSEIVEIISTNAFYIQKCATLASLFNICSSLLIYGEVFDTVPTQNLASDPGQLHYYVLREELLFKLPTKRSLFQQMRLMSSKFFDFRWMILKTEYRLRMDAVNPIRKLHVNNEELNPGSKWNLTEEDYYRDIAYLASIYRENDPDILRLRWEWGRKLWTLHGKRQSYRGWDADMVMRNGRGMEMLARRIVLTYNIL